MAEILSPIQKPSDLTNIFPALREGLSTSGITRLSRIIKRGQDAKPQLRVYDTNMNTLLDEGTKPLQLFSRKNSITPEEAVLNSLTQTYRNNRQLWESQNLIWQAAMTAGSRANMSEATAYTVSFLATASTMRECIKDPSLDKAYQALMVKLRLFELGAVNIVNSGDISIVHFPIVSKPEELRPDTSIKAVACIKLCTPPEQNSWHSLKACGLTN